MTKACFFILTFFAGFGCFLSASSQCAPDIQELWINAEGPGGDGLTPEKAAVDFAALLAGEFFQGEQPIFVYFMGSQVHDLPTDLYYPTYPIAGRCGVSFIGLETNTTINANYGLLLQAGYGPILIANLTFQECNSLDRGGAVRYLNDTQDGFILDGVTFQGCTSEEEGGAIFISTPNTINIRLRSTNFYNCSATEGGGGFFKVPNGSISLDFVQVVGCNATSRGGGLFISQAEKLSIEVPHIIATRNYAVDGAALFVTGDNSLVIEKGFFSCNIAENTGAAIYTTQSMTTIEDAWIYANINQLTDGEDLFSEAGSFTANNVNTTVACGIEGCCPFLPTTTTTTPITTTTEPITTTTITQTTTTNPSSSTSTSTPITFSTTSPSTTPSSSSSTSTTTTPTRTPPTTTTTTTTTTDGSISEDVCSGGNCTVLTFPEVGSSPSSNTTLTVGDSSLTVDSSSNSSQFAYDFAWGTISEVDPELSGPVKEIELSQLEWDRYTFANASFVFVSFQTTVDQGVRAANPIRIFFEGSFSQVGSDSGVNEANLTHSLKTSLSIEGDWQFGKPTNTLRVELVLSGEFVKDQCGRTSRIRNSTAEWALYELYGPNDTMTFMNLLKYCYIDGSSTPQSVELASPRLVEHGIVVDLTFPSFQNRLDYDPNLAVLLQGGKNSACGGSIFEWILPVSFLIGAGIVILAITMLGTTSCLSPYILGRDSASSHHIRPTASKKNRPGPPRSPSSSSSA